MLGTCLFSLFSLDTIDAVNAFDAVDAVVNVGDGLLPSGRPVGAAAAGLCTSNISLIYFETFLYSSVLL